MEGLTLESLTPPQPQPPVEVISPYAYIQAASQFSHTLESCIQGFWNLSPKARLFSVSTTPHYFWHMQDFYVAQKGLDTEGKRWAQLRLSEGLCQHLFERTLGKLLNEPDFTLATIRNFEVFLLERFSRKLFQEISSAFLKAPSKKHPPSDNEPLIHLVWALDGEPDHVNQVVLTVPQSCLKSTFINLEPLAHWQLPDSTFLHAHASVHCRLGSTRARLDELQHLEPGDIILLENSHSQTWHFLDPIAQRWYTVPVTVPERLKQTSLLGTQGTLAMTNEMQTKQNIWDNLQVEVTAAFNPIKLPLKQLKEMDQGLVVEVGDLMDNRVLIEVEGHPVAWGELLVIGDKFGVRIQGLHDAVEYVDHTSNAVTPMTAPATSITSDMPLEQSILPEDPPQNTLMDFDLDESDFEDADDDEDWA